MINTRSVVPARIGSEPASAPLSAPDTRRAVAPDRAAALIWTHAFGDLLCIGELIPLHGIVLGQKLRHPEEKVVATHQAALNSYKSELMATSLTQVPGHQDADQVTAASPLCPETLGWK